MIGEEGDTDLSKGSTEDHFLEWQAALCLLWSIENLSRLSTKATFWMKEVIFRMCDFPYDIHRFWILKEDD